MKTLLNVTILSFLLFFAGAKGFAQENENDKALIRQQLELPEFNAIETGGAFSVYLSQGEVQRVEVETKAGYLDKVELKVKNNVLRMSAEKLKNTKVLNVYITLQDLTQLEASGAATVKSETPFKEEDLNIEASGASNVLLDLDVQDLTTDLSGAAKMTLEGKAHHHQAELSGASELDAFNLETKVAEVTVSGAAQANINVLGELVTETSGAGKIYYKTKPETLRNSEESSSSVIQNYGPVSIVSDKAGDTTRVKMGNVSVEVIDDDSVKIAVGNNRIFVDKNGHVELKKEHRQKFNGHWAGFQMGVNGYLDKNKNLNVPDNYEFLDLNYAKSLNYQLNLFEQNINLANQHFGLITGLGFQWTIYCLSKDVILVADSMPIYGYHASEGDEFNPPYPDRQYEKSKLRLTYLTVPVLFEYQTNRFSKTNSFHVTGGVVGGWAFNIRSKAVWEDGGKQKRKVHDDYGIQPFRWDAYAGIGWGKINLFATYSLNPLFRENHGPELYPFTLGLTIVGW
jgi:hypothetical protein